MMGMMMVMMMRMMMGEAEDGHDDEDGGDDDDDDDDDNDGIEVKDKKTYFDANSSFSPKSEDFISSDIDNNEDQELPINDTTDSSISKEASKKSEIKKIYIIAENSVYIPKGKFVGLPSLVSKFLQFDNKLCVLPGEGNYLRPNYRCLLRYGIEKGINNSQSFIGCLVDAYVKYYKLSKELSIKEFKNLILEGLSIDNFITYNNGNLTHIFLAKNINNELLDSITIDETYKESNFYKSLNPDNKDHINLFKKIVNAFANFRKYLFTNNSVIDYTYLWDIVCKPNPKLFKNGINLLILDITNEDITQNVKVICPKQGYSNEFMDNNKLSLILLKKNNNYEPIYGVKDDSIENRYTVLFSFDYTKDEIQMIEFKKVINIIKDNINERCLTEKADDYDFERNIGLNELIKILQKMRYAIDFQVMNYENKIIGVFVGIENESKEIINYFVPCYPSNLYVNDEENIPYKFMDDDSINYTSYDNTKIFLNKLYAESGEKIKVKPRFKILNDTMIIGILTLGDQFVMISPFEIYKEDDTLPSLEENNYLINDGDLSVEEPLTELNAKSIDSYIQTRFSKDKERVNMINNIRLESGFYNAFKNTIKKLFTNLIFKKDIVNMQNIILNNSIIFIEKLKKVEEILRIMASDYIEFSEYDETILQNIKNVSLCINNKNCKTDFCMKKDDAHCSLIIPIKNLINDSNNEELYFTKLADEFIRYNRTNSFLFDNAKTLSYTNIRYNIDDDELIIYESSINKSLFNNELFIKNKYANYNNHEMFYVSKNEPLDQINTSGYRMKKPSIVLDDIQSSKKMKISIPQLKMDEITEYAKKMKTINEDGKEGEDKDGEDKDGEDKDVEDKEEEEELEYKEEVEIKDLDEELDVDVKKDFDDFFSTIEEKCKLNLHNKNTIREKGLKENFKVNLYETYFSLTTKDDITCSYLLPILLINHYYKNNDLTFENEITLETLKTDLINIYGNIEDENSIPFLVNTYQYINNEGFNKLIVDNTFTDNLKFIIEEKYKKNSLTSEVLLTKVGEIINSEKYYISYIDMYLLAKKYKIPLIFINNSVINFNSIKSISKIKKYLLANKNTNNDSSYYFIKLPSINNRDKLKTNKLMHKSNSLTINIKTDTNNVNSLKEDIEASITIDEDILRDGALITREHLIKNHTLKKFNITSASKTSKK